MLEHLALAQRASVGMAMASAANPPNRYLLTRHTGTARPVPAACQNEAETADIEQHQGEERTGPEQHDSS
jgi:hypothetical protein